MDQKTVAADPKRAIKDSKKKKKQPQPQPLKVVYITNPIKFTATASEFRALVQELTGQDSDVSDYSKFAAADKGGLVHAAAEVVGGAGGGADLSTSGGGSTTYEDDAGYFCSPEMIDNFQGMEASRLWHHDEEDVHLDVFKRLGAM